MKIHGYTDDKNLVPVDLPIEEIVSKEIDPWRLDLFDPDPVTLTIGKKKVNFRRRGDFAFAIKFSDTEVWVGIHDKGSKQFVVGTMVSERDNDFRVQKIAPVTGDFDVGLTAYLKHYAEHIKEEQFAPSPLDGMVLEPKNLLNGRWFLPPLAPESVKLRGNSLILEVGEHCHNLLKRFQFVGEMFTEVSVSAKLPEPVATAVRELAPWNPTMHEGESMRKLIAGKLPKIVRIYVDKGVDSYWGDPKSSKLPSKTLEVGRKRVFIHDRHDSEDIAFSHPMYDLLSVSFLRADKKGVYATRIALFDLGKRQARTVRPGHYTDSYSRIEDAWLEGFKILEVPRECERQSEETRARRVARANIPATRSIIKSYRWCYGIATEFTFWCGIYVIDACEAGFNVLYPVIEFFRKWCGRTS